MDLEGVGTLVDTSKLPLVMKCPIENYSFDKFRQMCIMSGCDYLASLPGIGLAKSRQFVTATQDSNFANALRKLPSFFNKLSLVVTDEYRENFLKAEATFKHQYVYDPLERRMVRLTEPDDEDIEQALCVNAGELLEPKIAFQLALGNLDPFTLKKMDDWHPDHSNNKVEPVKTDSWKDKGVSPHPSIWHDNFRPHLAEPCPWQKKVKKPEPMIAFSQMRTRKVVNLVSKHVPETQDESVSIQSLSSMYCIEPVSKKQRTDYVNETLTQYTQGQHNMAFTKDDVRTQKDRSPILENKERSFKKCLMKLSRFPRTVIDGNVVESNFFSNNPNVSKESITIEESPEKSRNPFKVKSPNSTTVEEMDTQTDDVLGSSQKENSPCNSPMKSPSPILEPSPRIKKPFAERLAAVEPTFDAYSEESVIENTYPMETLVTPVDSQASYGESPPDKTSYWSGSQSQPMLSQPRKFSTNSNGFKKTGVKAPGLRKATSLPSNQPTLLSKFGFQKKPVLKR